MEPQQQVAWGSTSLGIELGSTRIKAVLVDASGTLLAVGGHDWENQWIDQNWTYSLDDAWSGVRAAYADLVADVRRRHGVQLTSVGSLGISGMMHGYLPFDADGELLVPFRTWRNTSTSAAATQLSERLRYAIPQRWSVAHLYQAVLDAEPHVPRIARLTTLAGYVHSRLSGEHILGVGEASGMFPIDVATGSFDTAMLAAFDELVVGHGFTWRLADLLPAVLPAGREGGRLSEEGALLLDPSGTLQAGVLMAPPEGDAGTGMVATNSVRPRTANVSAGTSIFAMVVLERPLHRPHPELDLVTTPAGDLVAMVHCNNGASELNAWAAVFGDFARRIGTDADASAIFGALFGAALDAEPDAGGLLAYNYLSGEHNVGLEQGRPLFVRTPDSTFSLANFVRAQWYAMLATLRIGMAPLADEHVQIDSFFGHGGVFRTPGVGERLLAAALNVPVSVGEAAAEGGAWGMAVLAGFAASRDDDLDLPDYLSTRIFTDARLRTVNPEPRDVAGFDEFLNRFDAGMAIERTAIDHLPSASG